MSPRLEVEVVSITSEGSPPCPPGRTMSGPKEGLPPLPADAGPVEMRSAATAANAIAHAKRPERKAGILGMKILLGTGDPALSRRVRRTCRQKRRFQTSKHRVAGAEVGSAA